MAPKSIVSLILTILSMMVVLAPNEASVNGALVGGWNPIKDTTDSKVVEAATFAVNEYNIIHTISLSFERVVSGKSQVASGTNYKLVIAANDVGKSKNYAAAVFCPLNNGAKQLISFGEA